MTAEPMDCAAPERELVPFLAAGSLTGEERSRVQAHASGCAACGAELAASRSLLEGLAAAHLTADEVVDAAWDGAAPAHLADCARCRDEVEAIRASAADLGRQGTRPSLWRRPELAWAAALVLAIPAGLYVAGALRGGPADGPVVRGPSLTSRVTAPRPVTLAADAATVLPRAEVLLDFARAGGARPPPGGAPRRRARGDALGGHAARGHRRARVPAARRARPRLGTPHARRPARRPGRGRAGPRRLRARSTALSARSRRFPANGFLNRVAGRG